MRIGQVIWIIEALPQPILSYLAQIQFHGAQRNKELLQGHPRKPNIERWPLQHLN